MPAYIDLIGISSDMSLLSLRYSVLDIWENNLFPDVDLPNSPVMGQGKRERREKNERVLIITLHLTWGESECNPSSEFIL